MHARDRREQAVISDFVTISVRAFYFDKDISNFVRAVGRWNASETREKKGRVRFLMRLREDELTDEQCQ
jgi:hypothetical protein